MEKEQLFEGDIIPDLDVTLPPEQILRNSRRNVKRPYWPSNDANSPDYAHLPSNEIESSFNMTAADIESLIKSNWFEPHAFNNKVVFVLRGAILVDGHEVEDSLSIDIKNSRPNHLSFRCIIGLLDRETQRSWAYTGSSVPVHKHMLAYYDWMNKGTKSAYAYSGPS